MAVEEIQAKTLLRKRKRVDSWFVSRYGMNLYRGCAHACAYCDGRAERYRVEGDFGCDVAAKVNATELLARELDPDRRRKPLKPGYILLGGGVGDAYQPADARYRLARAVLEVIRAQPFGVHVLTKSTDVERDFDILDDIQQRQGVVVSMSLSSVDAELSRRFEPGCPPPEARLATLAQAKQRGFGAGVFLMPVLPLLTDTAEMIGATLQRLRDLDLDFVVFGGLTLKGGRQQAHFLDVVDGFAPELRAKIERLYPGSRWGAPTGDYGERVERRFASAARAHAVPARVPPRLWPRRMDANDRVVLVLEQLAYLMRLQGRDSAYQRAADAVAALDRPIQEVRGALRRLPGVGAVTEKLIEEVLETGASRAHAEALRPVD